MTDINARIDWQTGMELTAQAIKELGLNLDYKQRVANCIANNNRIGILPNSEFHCQGAFVKNVLEINNLKCRALLPSGKIVDADEDVTINIPVLYGDKYYLTVSFGDKEIQFDKEEVPFVRPQYIYELHSIEEIEQGDYMPIMKFDVADGMFTISQSFIAPCLLIKSNDSFESYTETYIEGIEQLADHSNLEEGEGKRCLLRYLFLLKSYDKNESTHNYMQFVQEIAQAVDYYIMTPNMETAPDIPDYSMFDAEEWLSWFEEYLDDAKGVLDDVVLEDHGIDIEKLKAEIKMEIHDQMYTELLDQIKKEIEEQYAPEIQEQAKEKLTQYIDDVLRKQLDADLKDELPPMIYDKLYQALYDALHDALSIREEKVEEVVEDEFVPKI